MSETSVFLPKFLLCTGCMFVSGKFVKGINMNHLGVMVKDVGGRKENIFFYSLPHYSFMR